MENICKKNVIKIKYMYLAQCHTNKFWLEYYIIYIFSSSINIYLFIFYDISNIFIF